MYGASEHNTSPNGELKCCCHNQDDPFWNATGPGTHYRRAKGWIYSPANLATTAAGTVVPWGLTPTHEFGWEGIGPRRPPACGRAPSARRTSTLITNRIYLCTFGQDTFGPRFRWAVAVFQVS